MKVCQVCNRRYPDNALRCPEDGYDLVELHPDGSVGQDDLVGRRMFGDYVIERKLGEGGMGAVYLAKQRSIGQDIAIKVLHGRALENSELYHRFVREARTITRLSHPNIIRVFIFGHTQDDLIYLAMEYVDGRTLRQALEQRGRMDELHAIYITKQVLAAASEAHDLGIIHRDMKPDNILLTEYRHIRDFVKVVDFGIAKVKEPEGVQQLELTAAGVVYGTPEYLSPEQAQSQPLDPRSDLYSIGVILYEMVTGRVPFSAPNAMAVLVQHAYDPPPDPASLGVPLSQPMIAILNRALMKAPGDRFQTAPEFLAELQACEAALKAAGMRSTMPQNQPWMPGALDVSAPSGGDQNAIARGALVLGLMVAVVVLLVVVVMMAVSG